MSTSPPDPGQRQKGGRREASVSTQKAVTAQGRLTDVRRHARIQSGDHGLHRVLGLVQDRLDDLITCYSLGTQNSCDRKDQSLLTASPPPAHLEKAPDSSAGADVCRHSGIFLLLREGNGGRRNQSC